MTDHAAPEPDAGEIERHLKRQTRRWHELGVPLSIELRALREGKQPVFQRFPYTDTDAIVDFAVGMNRLGRNIYAVQNPIRQDASIEGGARDTDIVASFLLWCDCDDREASANLGNLTAPRWSYGVMTGTVPHKRPHAYWELKEPVTDMAAWTQTMRAIARRLKSDITVTNPSRVMRVGGTVNHPGANKVARGYAVELTTLHTYDDAPRPPVSFEAMQRSFGSVSETQQESRRDGFHVDTGQHSRISDDELSEALRWCSEDGKKHFGVRRVSQTLAARGADRVAVEFIIRQACPVWDHNVEKLIDGAFANVAARSASFDHKPADEGMPAGWKIQTSAQFVADFVSPEYLIEGVMQRGRLYTLTGPTGTGKTAFMVHAAYCIAAGQQVCGLEVEQGAVLYLAGENPDDVRARVIGTLEQMGMAADLPVYWVPGTFSIRHDMEALKAAAANIPNIVLVVVDTFQAYFDGDDDNSNAKMLDFARAALRPVTQWPSKPCVVVPAHPVKDVRRGNIVPRGGSALLNEVDGNLTLWTVDGVSEVHWQGKHRGPDFEPLYFECVRYESPQLLDYHGRQIPTVIAKPVLGARAADLAKDALTIETRILQSIDNHPELSDVERAARLGIDRSKLRRTCVKLIKDKWIRKHGRKRALTDQGQEALKDGLSGIAGEAE